MERRQQMTIKGFPKALYKGTSVSKEFKIIDKADESTYEFQVGDIVEVGIKTSTTTEENYILYKKLTVTTPGTIVNLIISPEDTENLPENETAILEMKLTYNGGASKKIVYQDKIELKGVVMDE